MSNIPSPRRRVTDNKIGDLRDHHKCIEQIPPPMVLTIYGMVQACMTTGPSGFLEGPVRNLRLKSRMSHHISEPAAMRCETCHRKQTGVSESLNQRIA